MDNLVSMLLGPKPDRKLAKALLIENKDTFSIEELEFVRNTMLLRLNYDNRHNMNYTSYGKSFHVLDKLIWDKRHNCRER